MRRVFLAALLLGIAPATWPMYQYKPDHNAAFESVEPAHHWVFHADGKINGGLAVVGATIYVETFAPSVIALDRSSGHVLWKTKMPGIVMTTPIVADHLVIVGTGTNRVWVNRGATLIWARPGGDEIAALGAGNGHVVWTYKTVGEDMPSPTLVRIGNRDAVVFANGDDHVRALDVQTGRLLWGTRVIGVATMSSAALDAGVVYVLAGTASNSGIPGHVYALRANDGYIVWAAPYGNSDTSPVVGSGRIFVEDAEGVKGPPDASAINVVYALDETNGRREWARSSAAGFFTTIGTNEEAIAAMLDRGALFQSLPAARRFAAFDARTGRVLWSTPTQAAVKMSAVALAGRLYVGDTAGVLYTLAEGDGRILQRRRFGSFFTCSSPVVVGSTLYVADDSDVLAIAL